MKACTDNNDCSGPYETCDLTNKECKHKSLWPLEINEVIGTILLIFVAMFAIIAGIGGGAMIMPI